MVGVLMGYIPPKLVVPAGGTQDQVLAKASSTDFDTEWQSVAIGGAAWGSISGTLSNQSDLQTALNGKQAAGSYATAAQGATADSALQPAGNGSALTGLTKTQVGLANADNTSDAAKPVSTAQQTALDLKANLASPTFTGSVGGITASMVGLGNVNNTSDASKPVSTATQTALDAKQATSAKGQPNGYAGLDGAGLVPLAQLPGLPAAWGAITGVLSAQTDLQSAIDAKQATLVSATNIKTINGSTVLGSGDLVVTGAAPAFTAFTKDLGVSRRAGTFDITGLSGLTAGKVVSVVQTADAIASKGNAVDEYEMDPITLTGTVLNTTTIRANWACAGGRSVAVGTYAFAYQVSG